MAHITALSCVYYETMLFVYGILNTMTFFAERIDLNSLTLSELRKLGEELAIPGLNQIRNRAKKHLAKYIDWWIRLTQMEKGVELSEDTADSSDQVAASNPSSMLNPTQANHNKVIRYLDDIGVPVDPTPNLYVQTVTWDDWEFSEGYTEEEDDPFHHIDITDTLTGRTWMVSVIEHGCDFWEAFEKLTRTIKTLEFDFEEDAIYYRCFNFQSLPKATRLKLATLSALAVTTMSSLWPSIAKDCDHPGGNCRDRWNPTHFGEVTLQSEPTGQLLLPFSEPCEPPDPDDFAQRSEYEHAWAEWEKKYPKFSNNLLTSTVHNLLGIEANLGVKNV